MSPCEKKNASLLKGKIFVRYGADGREGALEIFGAGVGDEVGPGMSVGLKPNLVLARASSLGATTSPLVVSGVIEFLKDHGVTDITIMEGSWVGDETKRAWRACGYDEIARRYGVKLLDLKEDATRKVTVGEFTFEVCESPFNLDYLINIPVLKGHCQTLITCALKNLKGCLPDREKRRFHQKGLHHPIACLNVALKPDLILVDALCGDISSEEGGNPVVMNRLILGRDPVKVDSYGASLLGIKKEMVGHIVLSEMLGVGSTLLSARDIVEIGHDDTKANIKNLPGTALRLTDYIEEREACSACYASLIHALFRMNKDLLSSLRGDNRIKIGQGWRECLGKGIGVGNCASGFEFCARGCPPKAESIACVLEISASDASGL
ncbi:MAG: DUF362 domain-containing protein [Synergistaceae bacterium]|jgi:uncharacterized protein (DUF362 family)|nr:DUF362 domain-containing protein [Synergistaceae bacterium]